MRNPLTDGAVCGILGGVMEKEEDRRQVSTACRSVYMNVDTGEKTWLTPKYIVDALGPFDLDPCCPDGGMPWTTAKRMVTKSEDGLSVDWTGCRVWMNPPYGRESAPFFEKMSHHVSGGGQELRSSSRGRTPPCGTTSCSRTHAPSCSFAGASGSSAGMGASGTARRHRACSSGSRTTIRNVSARRLTREQSKDTM